MNLPTKTFLSKNNRPFKLLGINQTHATIRWIDTGEREEFLYETIKKYLG